MGETQQQGVEPEDKLGEEYLQPLNENCLKLAGEFCPVFLNFLPTEVDQATASALSHVLLQWPVELPSLTIDLQSWRVCQDIAPAHLPGCHRPGLSSEANSWVGDRHGIGWGRYRWFLDFKQHFNLRWSEMHTPGSCLALTCIAFFCACLHLFKGVVDATQGAMEYNQHGRCWEFNDCTVVHSTCCISANMFQHTKSWYESRKRSITFSAWHCWHCTIVRLHLRAQLRCQSCTCWGTVSSVLLPLKMTIRAFRGTVIQVCSADSSSPNSWDIFVLH